MPFRYEPMACGYCGEVFAGAVRRRSTPACCSERCRVALFRVRHPKPPAGPAPPRGLVCRSCGRSFVQSGRGRNRHRCGTCRGELTTE
jgi:hypothetical protein